MCPTQVAEPGESSQSPGRYAGLLGPDTAVRYLMRERPGSIHTVAVGTVKVNVLPPPGAGSAQICPP